MSNGPELSERLMKEDDGVEATAPHDAPPHRQWLHYASLGVAVAAIAVAAVSLDFAYSATQNGARQQHHAQTMRRVDQLINSDPLCVTSVDSKHRCLELSESLERISSANASHADGLFGQAGSGELAVGDTHVLAVDRKNGAVVAPDGGEANDEEFLLSLAAPAFDPGLCSYIWDDTLCLARYHHNGTGEDGISITILDPTAVSEARNDSRRRRRFYFDGSMKGFKGSIKRGAVWGGIKGGIHGAFVGAKTGGLGKVGGSAKHGAEWGAVKGGFKGAVHYVQHHFHRGSNGHRR